MQRDQKVHLHQHQNRVISPRKAGNIRSYNITPNQSLTFMTSSFSPHRSTICNLRRSLITLLLHQFCPAHFFDLKKLCFTNLINPNAHAKETIHSL
ncbi:unnamed protein product [Oikopleura dioica]|uniref:Uncharacterized protein n=1 Tax=Oikopleura dioica TaxID=34765 RepID=E4Y873_OIKDI|nr:unnamed protein product [Oikopleura dioica]